MKDIPELQIPDAVREMAERNVEQARSAYGQFLDMARKAQDTVARSSGVMAESAVEIQNKMLRYAQDNVDASFDLASQLARAKDLKEYLDIQTRFAQRQMQNYASQAQELGRLMGSVADKTKR